MANLPFKRETPIQLLSEDDVKKALGIDDFRKVTKGQVVQLVSSLSQMDPDVAVKVIEQVPGFTSAALDMAKEIREGYVVGLNANEESSKAALARIDAIIDILSEQLKNDGLTPEERMRIIECLNELAEKPVEIHRMNQGLILKGLSIVAGFAGAALLSAAALLGANGKVEFPNYHG